MKNLHKYKLFHSCSEQFNEIINWLRECLIASIILLFVTWTLFTEESTTHVTRLAKVELKFFFIQVIYSANFRNEIIEMTRFILCVVVLASLQNCIGVVNSNPEKLEVKTNAPIIGVLAQEISWHLNQQWPGVYESYIAASYIKFVEGGGARAVPIW